MGQHKILFGLRPSGLVFASKGKVGLGMDER